MRFMLTLGVGVVLGYNIHAKRDQSIDTIIDVAHDTIYDVTSRIKGWLFSTPDESDE